MAGRFITFEGGEGAGKSTQVRLLAAAFRAVGETVVTTREPGGSPGAEAIRTLLLSGRVRPLGTLAEAHLFAAARIDHLEETVRPALRSGAVVLCDRFLDSTRVYQGAAGGLDAETLDRLEALAVGDTRPDLTLVVDVPVAIGLARMRARPGAVADRFEADDAGVHEARRQAFLAIAAADPERCAVVDGTADPDAVAARIRAVVGDRLGWVLPEPGA